MAGVRNVVVQGGADGIGKGLASACLRRGDRVLVIGRSERTRQMLHDAHPRTAAHGSLATMIDSAGSRKAEH